MISLIIPTYNRPQFIARLLQYYRSLSFAHPVVVADSSEPSQSESNRRCIASLQGELDVRHEVFPPSIYPFLKVAQALATVDTEYAVLCADKDFLVPRGIEQCVHYLEANPDYSVAHGRAVTIRSVEASSGRRIVSHSYALRTIEGDKPGIRLHDHLQNYTTTFYSVHRRLELTRNMQLAVDNTTDFRFGELLPSCSSIIQGEAKCLDVLYLVRQYRPDLSTSGKTISWPALLTSDDFSQRYAQFRNCLAEELAGVAGVSIKESKEDVVNHAFTAYLAHLKPSAPSFEQTVRRVWRVIQVLPAAARSALLDLQLVAMARSPHEAYRKLQRERELAASANRDDMSINKLLDPQFPFHADFLPIYEYARRYPNGVMSPLQKEK